MLWFLNSPIFHCHIYVNIFSLNICVVCIYVYEIYIYIFKGDNVVSKVLL